MITSADVPKILRRSDTIELIEVTPELVKVLIESVKRQDRRHVEGDVTLLVSKSEWDMFEDYCSRGGDGTQN